MSKGGGGSTQTTSTVTQKADPWSGAQPYLKQGLGDLSSWYQSQYGRNPYPGSTVVPFNPLTEQAMGMISQRAINGSPLINAAQNQLQQTIQGDYLKPESNPYLRGTFDQAANAVQSRLGSEFNGSGNLQSSMYPGAMSSNLNDLATQIYGGAYDSERNRQMQANLFAPTMAQQDYTDAGQLANVGSAYEQQAGNYLQDAMSRYNFYQNAPQQRIQDYLNTVGGIASGYPSSQSTTQQPIYSNPTSSLLGGLSSLGGLGNSLGLFGGGGGLSALGLSGLGAGLGALGSVGAGATGAASAASLLALL